MSVKEEARLHRGVYIATLRSALEGWEKHGEFAERIGRTRQYLQYLLREDDPRTPGPETAERIANAVPLPPQQREDLLEHMLLAAERRLRAWRIAREWISETLPSETLERMRSAHWAATYAREPAQARPHYQLLRDLAVVFLRQGGLRRQPLLFVETCLLLHDAQSVLDRLGDALFHARLAGAVMRGLDPHDYRRGRERFSHLRVNAAYAEAVTLTTLGLPQRAEDPLAFAEASLADRPTVGKFWFPHIYRHQLAALSGQPRFSLYKAKELAQRAKSACDLRGDPLDPQVNLLVDVALARAYLRYGSDHSIRTAVRLLRPAVESIEHVPYLGPLHRVVILRTYARACWADNRMDEWNYSVHLAFQTATDAGLDHQARMIRQENGEGLGSYLLLSA